MDKKFRIKQWSGHYSASLRDANADRCFKKKSWGEVCQGIRTVVLWSMKEQEHHINPLELLAIKFALLTFSKMINFK